MNDLSLLFVSHKISIQTQSCSKKKRYKIVNDWCVPVDNLVRNLRFFNIFTTRVYYDCNVVLR